MHLQLQQQLQNYLLQAHQQGRQVVVFIEEAQRMPLETLKELRLLSDLETGSARLLKLVLFGQSELDQLVAYARSHGLANMCRLLFNLSEFVYLD